MTTALGTALGAVDVAQVDVEIELDPSPAPVVDDPEIELDMEEAPTAPIAEAPASAIVEPAALMQVLPADFPLPSLIRFVPDTRLKLALDTAAAYALSIDVAGQGAAALERADLARGALDAAVKDIDAHFEEPASIANRLHKSITGIRSEWKAPGEAARDTVGRRIHAERERLKAVAAEERRVAQAEADRQTREAARREAEAAARAQAPATVVRELQRQAETATAPPVAARTDVPKLRHSASVVTWKARPIGTAADAEPNPAIQDLTPAQREQINTLLTAILSGAAPIAAIEINWSYLNGRAKADKSTLQIPGIEAFSDGGTRSKSPR
jgi:hypothetical protein